MAERQNQTPEKRAQNAREKLERQRKADEVVDLKTAGFTFDQIAAKLGYKNKSTPARIWAKALSKRSQPKADQYRKQYDARTDRAIRAAVRILVDPKATNKDVLQAADVVGRIERDRARVLGYEAPQQHRHAGAANAPPINVGVVDYGALTELSDDDLAEAVQATADRISAVASAVSAAAAADGAGTAPPSGGEDGGSAG